MKKIFILDEVDCANCARKMEEGIAKIDGVIGVTINFLTQKFSLEAAADVFQEVLDKAKKVIKKVDPSVKVIEK